MTNDEFLQQTFATGPSKQLDANGEFLQSMFGTQTKKEPDPKVARNISESVIAGLQQSSGGLAWRGKMPDMVLGADAPWQQRLGEGAGALLGDAPAALLAGAAAAPTGPIGSGAAMMGAPAALRGALVEAYSRGHANTWEDVFAIAKNAAIEGAKGAAVGAVTMGAGKVITPAISGITNQYVRAATKFTGEIGAMTTASATLNGQMPTWRDFMDNALLIGGLHGTMRVAAKLRNIYAETGKTPAEMLKDTVNDPELLKQLQDGTYKIPDAYKNLATEERVKAAVAETPEPAQVAKLLTTAEEAPNLLSHDAGGDFVKYEYVTDKETANGVLKAVTQVYQDAIDKQTRGVVPNAETAVAGLKMATDGKIAPHVIGEANSAAELYARAHLLRGAANYAVRIMRVIADTPPAELTPVMKVEGYAALERVGMLKAELEGAGAEAGRALQILGAIKRDPTYLGDALSLLRAAERKGPMQDIARMSLLFKDSAQVADFSAALTKATTAQKVMEAWKAAILSGPQTHLANIYGNVMKLVVELPENVLAVSLEAGRRTLAGDPMSFAQWKARAFAPWYGFQFGTLDALQVMREIWQQKGVHLEKADVYRQANEGAVGAVTQLPFKLLQMEDAFFRNTAERAQAHIMAVDRALKEGYTPDTMEGREKIVLYTNHPEFGLSAEAAEAGLKTIQEAGAEAVFSQRLGASMEKFQRAVHGTPFEYVMPFIRTPTNLLSWSVQHVPGLNFMSGRWREDFAAGGERRSRAIARVVVGASLTGTALGLTMSGHLTGGGMFDPEEKNAKRGAGWQPYSLKFGDKYYSYQRIEPVGKVLGLVADLMEMRDVLKQKGQTNEASAKIMPMAVLLFGNATISTTYLSGLANTIKAVTDPNRYFGNFLESYAGSLVPKIVGQTAAAIDPYEREVNTVIDAIAAQIPGWRQELLPRRDVWGKEVASKMKWHFQPIATTTEDKDKVKQEAMRLGLAIADAPRYALEKGPLSQKERQLQLEPEQRDVFKEVSGKFALEILGGIVKEDSYDKLPDFAKALIFKKVIEAGRKQGMQQALPADAAARATMRSGIMNEVARQIQESESR